MQAPGTGTESTSTILLVDDEPANLRLLEGILRSPDYILATACNGEEALARAAALKPDLMLLDIMMPRLDGFEVCQRIRRDPNLGQLPIIMITAMDDRDGRRKAIEAGADDLLTKPVDRNEVRMRVRSITRLNRYRHFLEQRGKFEKIAELSRDGYVVIDPQGLIRYANPEACRMLRLPPGDNPGLPFIERLQSEFQGDPEHGAIDWAAAADPARRTPFRVVQPETDSGHAFWLQVEVLPADGPEVGGRLLRLIDVTSEVAAERDLWKFHTQMAHKLRTPLVGLVGALDLLALDKNLPKKADTAELLELSRDCLDRLREHIEDVLQYLDAPLVGRMANATPLQQIPDLVRKAAEQTRVPNIRVVMSPELQNRDVRFSHKAMELSLIELLDNARKFHPHRAPRVEVVVEPAGPSRIVLRVQDDGETVPPARLGRVWQPYYQGEKIPTGEVSGMGLGLPMIASMVREQGGSCRFSNRADGPGVSVELHLNLDTARQP
jgi:PAS domain S-box-containing protein